MTDKKNIQLLLADPHRLYAEAIQQLLRAEGIDVLGICVTGEETLAAVDEMEPTIVLVDVALPDVEGIELGQMIVNRSPATKVVLITPQSHGATGRAAIESGLQGYVTRQSTIKQLISSISAVNEGNVVMPPSTATSSAPAASAPRGAEALAAAFQLTPREREVLQLLHGGASSKQIAKELSLRPNTVRTHVQNVLTKLQVHSRLEAAAVASKHGLVEQPKEPSSF